jgi:hypothetical protein
MTQRQECYVARAPARCGRNLDNSEMSKILPTLYTVPCDPREQW